MSESQSQSVRRMKVKVILGTDIRRWRYRSECGLKLLSLQQFVESSFNLASFWLQYEDDEGDRLTLSSQNDFEDGFDCAQKQQRKSLKIYVRVGSIGKAQKGGPMAANTADSNCKCPAPTFEMKAAAIDFLQNAEIMKLLPDLHRRIFEEIKKCQTAAQSQEKGKEKEKEKEKEHSWDSPQNVEQIMRGILSGEDKFSPIISHQLYRQKLQFVLPLFAAKISSHLCILMDFSTEAIAAWIPHLTAVLTHGISRFGDSAFGGDGMSTFFPLMCSFMSQHGDYSAFDENGDVIHVGVACDECNVQPIKGARYKCCICSNYDLCSRCESFGKHNAKHPRLKFNDCARNAVPPFMGLHEIMSQFGRGPHKWFGHHWKGRFAKYKNKERAHHNNGQPWWNGEGAQSWQAGHGRGGGGAWKRWGRYPQHNNQWQAPYDCATNPWQEWCDNRGPNEANEAAANQSSVSAKNKKVKVMADFVRDVTLKDRTSYPIDTVLTKTWRMKNNGDYEWGASVELVFFKGNESLTLEQRYPVLNAQPGQEVEVSAVIKTPRKPGRYCSYYRLQRNGEYFGPRVWVDIFAVDAQSGKSHKKQQKLEAKQLKLQAKRHKLASKLENVNKALDLQGENANSVKLVQKQQKLEKQQKRINKQVDKLQNENVIDEQQLLDDIANAAVQDLEREIESVRINLADVPLSAISCVCGTVLHKTSPIEAYSSSAQVNCDICGKFCASASPIYHCPNVKSVAHPEGYDLCGSCVEYQMQGFIPNVNDNGMVFDVVSAPPVEAVQNAFEYQQELEQLRAMNIADDTNIKNELIKQKGNVQRVANSLLQLQ